MFLLFEQNVIFDIIVSYANYSPARQNLEALVLEPRLETFLQAGLLLNYLVQNVSPLFMLLLINAQLLQKMKYFRSKVYLESDKAPYP